MKVLIAIDSSPASQRVLEEVVARTWLPNTSFSVATAVDVVRFAELPTLIDDARRECGRIVEAGAAILARAKHQATTAVLTGSPRKVISGYAADWEADLVFVGSHGHGAVGRFLLGSTTQGILRTAACSVEIVRSSPDGRAPSSHPMKVLLATDGSECSLAAARAIAAQAWPAESVTRVLGVEELVSMPIPMEASSLASVYPASLLEELIAAARNHARESVKGSRKLLQHAGIKLLDQTSIPTGDPRGVILDAAETWPADLIVLGSHGRRGLDRLLMGSVAESVALHAHCSVQIVRSR